LTSQSESKRHHLIGTWYAILAFGLWGILPVYWKLLKKVPPYEIVAYRVLWTCIFTGSLLIIQKKRKFLKQIFKEKSKFKGIFFCALLLSLNWLIYIYAVNSDHVLDASLGYYINPLISVFLGLMILKEKTNLLQKLSIALAFIGVLILTVNYGKIPWIALALAFTFGIYGLIKKTGKVDPFIGLNLETLLMIPVSLTYIFITTVKGHNILLTGTGSDLLLVLSTGLVTAIPLLFFAKAAQNIPLSRVGFIQYLTPTCFFLLGRFVYREPFTHVQLISFIFIWIALVLYSCSGGKSGGQPLDR
jgi:chloramphenicol-sensitive protein RarD